MPKQRNIDPESKPDDHVDNAVRHQKLNDLIGQENVKDNLSILIDTARQREEALENDLFYGPPGLRKTTLAHVVDIEVGQAVTVTTDALSDITMEAVVTSISQSSYTQSGDMLYTVYIAVDDVDEPSDGA